MRLSKIKLAGFKSFVDPTTFSLPSDLVGIVGPNGCGKSNVIDAVRWVMGEMSAKHLRGDSMADVIFNGSASRKPVGTASIELFFDNSDGSIGGQYAQYAEIALKRTISRDGTSSYFLNNTRCRRKDITELFLGTGLGSRSYAIIEQGMVSRLVEAKPEEMRTYIEEAAGISKYKERRRETETRIQHTRDNLARLNDLREEITKQIDYLQRQAKTAERYKDLKGRERRLEAELLAIRLTDLDNVLQGSRLDLEKQQTGMEAAIAEQRRIEAEIVAARERHVAATETFNRVQARHYDVQSEISRLEQGIAHAREIRDRQLADLAMSRQQAAALDAELRHDRVRLQELDAAMAELEPSLVEARDEEATALAALERAEKALEEWQDAWQAFNLEVKELQQAAQVESTRVEHLEAQLAQLGRQQESIEQDRAQLSIEDLNARVTAQAEAEQATAGKALALQQQLDESDREADRLRQRERELGAYLEQVTAELASAQGQLAALRAMQQAALGSEDPTLTGWLARESLATEPRLAQRLQVEERWLLGVETVLGDFLQAVCVNGFAHHLGDLPDTQFALVEAAAGEAAADERSLLAHVGQPGRIANLLADVVTARDLAEAVEILRGLDRHQSVITPDGIWLGHGWVRVNRGQRSAAGLLAREHQIRDLQDAVRGHEHRIGEIETSRESTRSRLTELAEARGGLTQAFNAANREHAEALAVLENLRQEIARARERHVSLDGQRGRLIEEISAVSDSLASARERGSRAGVELEALSGRRPELQRRQQELLSAYNEAREVAESRRAATARINVEAEGRRVARESAAAAIERVDSQQRQLLDRLGRLKHDIEAAEPAVAVMQSELSTQLARKIEVDRELARAREELEQVEAGLRASEGHRSTAEKAAASARETVDALRLQVREAEVRRESVMESFTANGAELDTVLTEMPADADAQRWQENLDEVRRKIERLGPINLAAIEQFNEQSERKKYLDAQNADLTSALDTLEQAIRKIDRETRSRFQETFENINQGLKRIFPRLFGGGHAYLSLEGEDILAAGVTVMARPPGKRNSHIHLLSGGEKALTAVALIFSIFELNPAPFCLLDEVDAPLDEANVGRFCEIVREMSQRVQFVVITHNKATMEMVNQLTGVTMNEPGVSRLVSVDLDAAVQLAAS
jgi:chromosome segregation protein